MKQNDQNIEDCFGRKKNKQVYMCRYHHLNSKQMKYEEKTQMSTE